jgi:hypothetical protein
VLIQREQSGCHVESGVAGIYNRYAYLPEKRALCHGKPAPDWLATRLEHTLPLLASRSGDRVVETQAKMIACAKFLRDWLPLYAHVAEMCDEVYSHLPLGDDARPIPILDRIPG